MSTLNPNSESNNEVSKSKINWLALTDLNQLNAIGIDSNLKHQLIFKHSTRCIISRTVLKQFENEFNLNDKIDMYMLDLLEYRPISNQISEQFDVEHQSPQVLLIKDNKVIYSANHESIDAVKLNEFMV